MTIIVGSILNINWIEIHSSFTNILIRATVSMMMVSMITVASHTNRS